MNKFILICFITFIFIACKENQIKLANDKKGQLEATMELHQVTSKCFTLDDETAPKPLYVQLVKDSAGSRQLTFLNNYNNSIYFYNYEDSNFKKK